MGLCRILQGVGLVDFDFYCATSDNPEQITRPFCEFLAGCDMVGQRWPGQEQGSLAGEDIRIDGGDRTRCVAEQRHDATWTQAVERTIKCVLADGIIDHRHAGALGDAFHPVDEILLAVIDHMVAAMVAGEIALFLAATILFLFWLT